MTGSATCAGADVVVRDTIDGLQDAWDDLLARSYDNRLFLTYRWLKTWMSCAGGVTPRLWTIEESGKLSAVLPMMRTGDDTLTLLGDPEVMDYMDGLADRGEAQRLLQRLWRGVAADESWRTIQARHIPAGSPLLAALRQVASDSELTLEVEDDSVCPVAILCNNWDGYLEMLSKKQRHEVRRKLRRARADAAWEWRHTETPEQLDRDLTAFFRLHEASARDKADFLTEDMRRFFRAVATEALAQGWLRLRVFSRDGVDIASTFSFLYRERWLLYNSGYDPAYAANSPGIAAVAMTIQDAIEERAVAFDFLSGDEPYKYQLGGKDTHTSRVVVTRS